MCVNPSKQEFDILYKELMEANDAIKTLLNAEHKEK